MSTITDCRYTLSLCSRVRRVSGMSRSKLYRCIKSGVLRARPVGSVMRLLRDNSLATINALPAVGE